MAQMGVSPRLLVGVVLAVLTVCVLVFHFSDADASSKSKSGFFCRGPMLGYQNADGEVTALVAVGSKGCEEVLRAAVTR